MYKLQSHEFELIDIMLALPDASSQAKCEKPQVTYPQRRRERADVLGDHITIK